MTNSEKRVYNKLLLIDAEFASEYKEAIEIRDDKSQSVYDAANAEFIIHLANEYGDEKKTPS